MGFGRRKPSRRLPGGRSGRASGCLKERRVGFGRDRWRGPAEKGRQPTCAAEFALGDADQRIPFALAETIGTWTGNGLGHRLQDERLADAPEIAGAGRLPPIRHVDPDCGVQRIGMGERWSRWAIQPRLHRVRRLRGAEGKELKLVGLWLLAHGHREAGGWSAGVFGALTALGWYDMAQDRRAVVEASSALRYAAGNFYINDKPTGAVVGQQPFGGARGSGTNDKAGSYLNLIRWVSPRTIKETFVPPTDHRYPFLG